MLEAIINQQYFAITCPTIVILKRKSHCIVCYIYWNKKEAMMLLDRIVFVRILKYFSHRCLLPLQDLQLCNPVLSPKGRHFLATLESSFTCWVFSTGKTQRARLGLNKVNNALRWEAEVRCKAIYEIVSECSARHVIPPKLYKSGKHDCLD